jgi:cytochrome c553
MRVKTCTRCGETKPLDQFPPVRRSEPERLQWWCRTCFSDANKQNYWRNHEREKARLLLQTTRKREENRRRAIEYLLTHPCVACGEKDIVVLQFDHLRDKKFNVSTMIANGSSWERIEAEIAKCVVRCANCHRLKTAQTWNPYGESLSAGDLTALLRIPAPIQLLLEPALQPRRCRVCGRTRGLSEFPFRSLALQTRQWICLECQRSYSKDWYGRNRTEHITNVGRNNTHRRRERREQVRAFRIACVDCGIANPVLLDFDHLRDKVAEISQLVNAGMPWAVIKAEIDKCEVRCANCHARKTARERGSYRTKVVGL